MRKPSNWSLTTDVDNITGTSGNDVFIGDNGSLSAGDTLDGGAGVDTLKIYGTNTKPVFSNIEKIYLNAPGGNFDISGNSDVSSIEMDSETGSRTLTVATGQDVKLTNVSGGQTTTIAGNTPTSLNLEVDKAGSSATTHTVALSGTALAELNIKATGSASNVTVTNAGGKLATINVSGDQNIRLAESLTTVTKIDASNATGNVNVAQVGASNLTFTGGKGDDRINIANSLTNADNLNGGDGTDTIAFSDADTLTSGNTTNVSGFEVLEVTTADTTAYNVANIGLTNNPLTGIVISESGGTGTTINNINADAVNNISFVGDTPTSITLTAAGFVSGGTSDTATIILDNSIQKNTDGVDIATSLTFNNVDKLNVKSVSDGTPATAEQNSIAGLVASDLETIVVTGDQSVSITTGATTTSLSEVDASGMTGSGAGLTLNTSASSISSILVKGTAKNDTIDVSANNTTATIYTGGGTDQLTIDSGQSSTLMFTGTTVDATDLKGAQITIGAATAVGDLIFNFTSALEGVLKIGGNTLSSLTANTNVSTTGLSGNDSIYYNESAGDSIIQFDLNGDGVYTAADDMQITITGGATNLANLTYNAANDYFITA